MVESERQNTIFVEIEVQADAWEHTIVAFVRLLLECRIADYEGLFGLEH